jgi:hypothetical protein
MAEIGMPLRICLNCSGRLIPAIYTIAASAFSLSDDWLSAISYFFIFKGRGSFKFSIKYLVAKHYTYIYWLVLLLTHLSFCWTVPLKNGKTTKLGNQSLKPHFQYHGHLMYYRARVVVEKKIFRKSNTEETIPLKPSDLKNYGLSI